MILPIRASPSLRDEGLAQVYLLPGELYCSATPTLVRTILGSCIAVCLWDPVRRIGGLNHYVLPRGAVSDRTARYGDIAIAQLKQRMLDLGCQLNDLRAKIFGGAAVLPTAAWDRSVGAKNLKIALERLQADRIPIIARRTGGADGLIIQMNTATGEVDIRKIPSDIARDAG